MIKNTTIYSLFLGLILTLASCGEATTAATDAMDKTKDAASKAADKVGDAMKMKAVKAKVITEKSKVQWTGEMLGVYSHEGILNIKSGTVEMADKSVAGGSFVVDLKSMRATDANFDEAAGKTKDALIGHLSSADFFDVENYPEATFKIESVKGTTATGKLTIKGKTNQETITDVAVTKGSDNMMVVSGNLTFDRQNYGVVWAHPVKENVLSDDIVLGIKMTVSI